MKWINLINKLSSKKKLREYFFENSNSQNYLNLKNVIIVGMSSEGIRLKKILDSYSDYNLIACADDNLSLKNPDNSQIYSINELDAFNKDCKVIICSHRPLKLFSRLKKMGFNDVISFWELQVLFPEKFPPHMFYEKWFDDLSKNLDKYNVLFDIFKDKKSHIQLDAILGYRLTADIKILERIIDPNLYNISEFRKFDNNEIYYDCGAFDGDSIEMFKKNVDGVFERIVAFEPDNKTYLSLKKNFENFNNIDCINKAVSDLETELSFVNDGSRGAFLDEGSTFKVKCTSIDNFSQISRISFIKMNIEGGEIKALKGAVKTIKKWSPTLAISVYHRVSDLWYIPLQIRSYNENYKLSFRHHDLGIIESVCYAYK